MPDMSKNEAAFKHFRGLQKRYEKTHNGVQCEHVKAAIEALENAHSWIPASESLPPDGCYVLLELVGYPMCAGAVETFNDHTSVYADDRFFGVDKLAAWRELPEPYHA